MQDMIGNVGWFGGNQIGCCNWTINQGTCIPLPVIAPGKEWSTVQQFTVPGASAQKITVNVFDPLKECKK